MAVEKAFPASDSSRRHVQEPESQRALRAGGTGRFLDVLDSVLRAAAVPGRFRHVAERGGTRHYAARRVHYDRQHREWTGRFACAQPESDAVYWLCAVYGRIARRRDVHAPHAALAADDADGA